MLWTEYQMLGKDIYSTIFRRVTEGRCPVSNCRFTTDRSLQAAILYLNITRDEMPTKSHSNISTTLSEISMLKFLLQNESAAILFHMPNLHWENYTYPQYRSVAPQLSVMFSQVQSSSVCQCRKPAVCTDIRSY